jgi:hypothetical protein
LTTGHILAIDRSGAAVAQARAGAADLIAAGRLSVRQTRVEDLVLEPEEERYDLVFAVRVSALDGRHPEAGEVALQRIALATTPDARLFVDGGEQPIPRR